MHPVLLGHGGDHVRGFHLSRVDFHAYENPQAEACATICQTVERRYCEFALSALSIDMLLFPQFWRGSSGCSSASSRSSSLVRSSWTTGAFKVTCHDLIAAGHFSRIEDAAFAQAELLFVFCVPGGIFSKRFCRSIVGLRSSRLIRLATVIGTLRRMLSPSRRNKRMIFHVGRYIRSPAGAPMVRRFFTGNSEPRTVLCSGRGCEPRPSGGRQRHRRGRWDRRSHRPVCRCTATREVNFMCPPSGSHCRSVALRTGHGTGLVAAASMTVGAFVEAGDFDLAWVPRIACQEADVQTVFEVRPFLRLLLASPPPGAVWKPRCLKYPALETTGAGPPAPLCFRITACIQFSVPYRRRRRRSRRGGAKRGGPRIRSEHQLLAGYPGTQAKIEITAFDDAPTVMERPATRPVPWPVRNATEPQCEPDGGQHEVQPHVSRATARPVEERLSHLPRRWAVVALRDGRGRIRPEHRTVAAQSSR